MLFLINFAGFELAWLSSVIGGAREMPWLGPLAVLIVLAIHLSAARKPFDEFLLIACCALIGACFDSALVAFGWVSYKAGLFSEYLAPYWIITMWMLFATTLNVSMRWLRGKPGLAALFGLIGGPVTYAAGEKLGGIILASPVAAMVALGLGWALIMPILMRLSETLDGMPGRRRAWVAESSR
ncbi:MAG: DUF2878 domain-containing protein [Gammaproteobacteria bacterium]|nr:DUF2878 domain-containing protein [Gammaproteobacteria bacterium]